MLIGYNTNVPYKGTIYHVQTEDIGVKAPVIITLLYVKGTILASKKTSYADVADSTGYEEKVRELMKNQHKAMIKELIAGKHTAAAAVEAAPETPPRTAATPVEPETVQSEEPKGPPRSLDDILLDYILKGKR